MDERFAVGLVVYGPPGDLIGRLQLLRRLGEPLYVFDNSPQDPRVRDALRGFEGATYITAGKNLGLGVGLSAICAQAHYDSFANLLFFDQDTVFDQDTLDFVGRFIREAGGRFAGRYSAVVFASGDQDTPGRASDGDWQVTDVTFAISSGSLFFLQQLKALGWHNETYFVDGVDYELCLRSRAAGLKVGRCGDAPGFDHVSGQPDRRIRLLGRDLSVRRYSAARIRDAIGAYVRLFFSSVRLGQWRFAGGVLRSCAIYLTGQVMARIVRRAQ